MQSSLGFELFRARREAGLTQAALAACAGVSLPTIRQAETGKGSLTAFFRLTTALGLEIGGRTLPPGVTIGTRLALLRERQGLGRRTVATLAGCSATTLAALEADRDGHLAVAIRVAEALGVQLTLARAGQAQSFWNGAGTSSAFHGWTTPPEVLEALYVVVGGQFGLDPCSPARSGPRAPVRARMRFTLEDDGLRRPWRATSVYVNPPYGRELPKWVAKARREQEEGRAGLVVALVPARTDTRWWHDDIAGRADVWMLKGRLSFGDGMMPAPFPSAIIVWSAGAEHRAALIAAFPDAWHVARGEASEASIEKLAAD